MPSAGLEPAVPGTERPQTHALVRTATGIGTRVRTKSAESSKESFAFREEVSLTSYWQQ